MLEGELVFQVADERFDQAQGELAFAPRNVAQRARPQRRGRALLLLCTPARLERHFARAAARRTGRRTAGMGAAADPEITVVGPQIAALTRSSRPK